MINTAITKIVIYPGVGIARVGNAVVNNQDDFFIGPELAGMDPRPPGGFKDKKGRVKKQAARFRVYGFDKDNNPLGEITAAEASIAWRVHLCNRKAAWYQFNNALDLEGSGIPAPLRNRTVTGRTGLVIDGGPVSISGNDTHGAQYQFNKGAFMGTKVPLGELRTDEKGRLLVLGGDGSAASYTGAAATTFANNDTWHDDVSDGPVRATITFEDGMVMEAEPAMVAVTPPNFGQGLYPVVSMYDVVYSMHAGLGWVQPGVPDFNANIYPLLNRIVQTQWVNQGFFMLFGQNSPADFTQPALQQQLSSTDLQYKPLRQRVFNWFRNPLNETAIPQAIPPLYGDAFGDYENLADTGLAVTTVQYEWLRQWAAGVFTCNEIPQYASLEDVPLAEQPHMSTMTNLDNCLGGPFHPGIELTWCMRVPQMWKQAFRLNIMAEDETPADDWGPLLSPKIALGTNGPLAASGPGTLTRWMGVPWQTDEASCLSGYDVSAYLPVPSFWAARVPNQVLSGDGFKRIADNSLHTAQRLKHFDYRQDWLRDFGSDYQKKINAMVAKWHYLGILVNTKTVADNAAGLLPSEYWVETDRRDFDTEDPSYLQVLYAENAATQQMDTVADHLAASEKITPAPKRKRKIMRRDER